VNGNPDCNRAELMIIRAGLHLENRTRHQRYDRASIHRAQSHNFGTGRPAVPAVSLTYRHAVAVPHLKPGHQLRERHSFAQVGQHQ
jgi:hypothetical protein